MRKLGSPDYRTRYFETVGMHWFNLSILEYNSVFFNRDN